MKSWGGYPVVEHRRRYSPHNLPALQAALKQSGLPVGAQRSYGDACLNAGGNLIGSENLDRFLQFDTNTGRLRCEPGVRLRELITVALRQGWFPPVLPGTAEVTVAGAIAHDVHGKNHQTAGTFGCHVTELELLRPGDTVPTRCSQVDNPALFAATIGGLGQTGFITAAGLQLKRVPGPWLDVERAAFEDLDEFMALSDAADQTHEYTVAWLNCLDHRRIRGIFFRANHASDARPSPRWKQWPGLPVTPPVSLINPLSMSLFNRAYHWRQSTGPGRFQQHWQPFFFPLDAIPHWNRIYGPRGFRQLQCVVPSADGAQVLGALLERIAAHRSGSFLSVLKKFGNLPSPGLLSFPQPGLTLALDLPNRDKLGALMHELHQLVHDAGGRIYAAKDADLSAAHFQSAYPQWVQWRQYTHPALGSDLVRRITKT